MKQHFFDDEVRNTLRTKAENTLREHTPSHRHTQSDGAAAGSGGPCSSLWCPVSRILVLDAAASAAAVGQVPSDTH